MFLTLLTGIDFILLQTQLVKTEVFFAAKEAEWKKNKQQLEEKILEHKLKRRKEISNMSSMH